jgi:hypothetical protein
MSDPWPVIEAALYLCAFGCFVAAVALAWLERRGP